MNDRKAARKKVAELLDTIATLQAVYDHETIDFERVSPIAMVHSDGTRPGPGSSFSSDDREHALIISLWWLRTETTEDSIDDLSAEVYTLIETNKGANATWSALTLDNDFSALDYPPLEDGKQYRRERIRVFVW